MKKWAVIYSSATGNTKQIAEAIAQEAGADLFRVQDVPEDISEYEVVALGYWLKRGGPDPLLTKYLPQVHDTQVLLFQTHGAAPGSEHAVTSFARAAYLLGKNCTILGTFGCRGKIAAALASRVNYNDPNDPHGGKRGEERHRLAATHPDAQDLENAKQFVRDMQHKLELLAAFHAKMAAKQKAAKKE